MKVVSKMGDPRYFVDSRFVKELSPANYSVSDPTKLGGGLADGLTAVMYYADWCPHCKDMRHAWEGAAKKCVFASFAAFDCAKFPKRSQMLDFVESYPTVALYRSGAFVSTYDGERDEASIVRWMLGARSTPVRRGDTK